jgi:YjbE family integral membrane protein
MPAALVDPAVTMAEFWVAFLQITGVNILLSGDNAVVIALASRALPERERRAAVIGGSVAAILLRILFCLIIAWLLGIPYLKLAGGLALLWIGVKLMLPESDGGTEIAARSTRWGAIGTIAVADTVMSLDNAAAIGAAANGNALLIVLGLLVSVPLIVFGSQIVLGILLRFPLLVSAGAGLLGWIAGEIIVGDPAVSRWTGHDPHAMATIARPLLAALVVATGTVLARRAATRPRKLVDLAPEDRQ